MKREEQLALKKVEYEGKVYPSTRFGDVKILEYKNNKQVVIMFLNTGFITEESMGVIRSGHIRDSSLPTTCGFGYIDVEGASIGRNMTKEYQLWNNMINRCYNEKGLSSNPTYKDCHVSEDWRYLSNFKEWCNNQIGFDQDGWQLDKDILVKGNKVYSEDTCCFVPPEINSLFVKSNARRGECLVGVTYRKDRKKYQAGMNNTEGSSFIGHFDTELEAFLAYKQAKESKVKEVAELYKDQIDPRVYEALMNWTIEITD